MDKEIPEWILEAAEKYVGQYQAKHEPGMAESVARFFAEAFEETGLLMELNSEHVKNLLMSRVHEPKMCGPCKAITRARKVRK